MKYLVIDSQRYTENTPEYGCGDYSDRIDYILAIVEGDTVRKAQNAVKKLYPRVRFGGINSPMLIEVTDNHASYYTKPADIRLSRRAVHTHRECLEILAANGVTEAGW